MSTIIKRIWPRVIIAEDNIYIYIYYCSAPAILCVFRALSAALRLITIYFRYSRGYPREYENFYYAPSPVPLSLSPLLLCSYLPNSGVCSQLPAPFPRFSSSLTKFSAPCQLPKRLKSFRALAKLNARSLLAP